MSVASRWPRCLEPLLARVESALGRLEPMGAREAGLRRVFVGVVLRGVAERALARAGLPVPNGARLFSRDTAALHVEGDGDVRDALDHVVHDLVSGSSSSDDTPELLGGVFEALLALEIDAPGARSRLHATRRRRHTGSFFTPSSLTAAVVERALDTLDAHGRDLRRDLLVCDPACGAGAFLVAVARSLLARRRAAAEAANVAFDERAERRRIVERCLAGVDIDPLAVAVTEIILWAFAGDPALAPASAGRLFVGDAVAGRGFGERAALDVDDALDWRAAFPEVRSFDLVIGNPPWIAYAGRASQPIAPRRRAFLAASYAGFRGYPTLHAVFVERAAELAPAGVIALVVPSPIADLDGYRPLRRVLFESHVPCEPMLEFGQDAFSEVTQPCFALVARPRDATSSALEPDAARPFRLSERARHGAPACAVDVPQVLARLASGPRFPPELFREMGFQSTRVVTQTLFSHADAPDELHTYPLLEGRQVSEFRVGAPRLFLRPDLEVLRRAGCRLRDFAEYRAVRFVVRQTAKVPIAALHSGVPFRNSLLAGFDTDEFPAELLVGLLNSALYRAFHVSSRRDARQAVFPQVKIAHLRALPRPPERRPDLEGRIRRLVVEANARVTPELRRELDTLVFSLFDFGEAEKKETLGFLFQRVPELRY